MQWGGSILAGTSPGIIWDLMPAGKTTWLHQTTTTLTGDATQIADCSRSKEVRFFTSVQVAGAAANTLLALEYSIDGSAWSIFSSITIANSTGFKDSGWWPIPQPARTVIYLRLVGENGDGIASPRFSPPNLLIR